MSVKRGLAAVAAATTALFAPMLWAADDVKVGPQPWQLGLQPSASPTMDKITWFHDILLIIITVISVFVLALLIYVAVRFRESKNPNPSTTTHHAVLEVAWTAIPIIILVAIAIPSFKLLYFADRIEKADMTLKVIGNQWNWTYQYPDHGNFEFTANLLQGEDLNKAKAAAAKAKSSRPFLRQLSTDNPVVLPVGKKIRLILTASDVLHAWAISPLGVRLDTVPGRLNETWVEIKRPGTYFGYCSELCGAGHAYMPIEVHAVSMAEFEKWTKSAKKKFARVDTPQSPDATNTAEKKTPKDNTIELARKAAAQ
ncbi:MAG TPA: cytochrome c oxidase subunit II [Rhodospirillaceae bacterium]|nr:cytochrome c oxidase subunit II [Rhodospirillaceae bacterium]HAA93306.1 cytochrome c oxidase subunit II [Rhodospirillaceae bacterium]HAT35152.1 cytochrome c oxidase subunit II [Rhodospirillaceae bacterium]